MKSHILFTVLTINVCCGIGQAQQCPTGCQMKIDALQNQLAALQRAISQAPYLQKFVLNPTSRGTSHSLSAEQELPNYLNALLIHVTVDHTMVAVLFPGVRKKSSGQMPNEAEFAAGCHATGKAISQGKANVGVFLGLLRQESGKDVYGIKVAVDGCDAETGQIPVEITVLSKP